MCQKEEDMSSYKEGQVHQLANALEAAGFTPGDITKLGQSKELPGIRGLFHGTHKIRHLIDCDANPFIPDGWEVEQHYIGGLLEWNAKKAELYLSKKQKDGNLIRGNKLRKELKNKPTLNANVLDHLLKNPHLIPEEWKDKCVFFWGTVYRDPEGDLMPRCLCWDGDEWDWRFGWLIRDFGDNSTAALNVEL